MFFQRVGIQRALKGLHGEADRQRLQAELTACKTEAPAQARLWLRAQLRGFLDDWPGFLSGNVAEARPVLHLVLADRIGFTPMADRGYQLDSTRGPGKAGNRPESGRAGARQHQPALVLRNPPFRTNFP